MGENFFSQKQKGKNPHLSPVWRRGGNPPPGSSPLRPKPPGGKKKNPFIRSGWGGQNGRRPPLWRQPPRSPFFWAPCPSHEKSGIWGSVSPLKGPPSLGAPPNPGPPHSPRPSGGGPQIFSPALLGKPGGCPPNSGPRGKAASPPPGGPPLKFTSMGRYLFWAVVLAFKTLYGNLGIRWPPPGLAPLKGKSMGRQPRFLRSIGPGKGGGGKKSKGNFFPKGPKGGWLMKPPGLSKKFTMNFQKGHIQEKFHRLGDDESPLVHWPGF